MDIPKRKLGRTGEEVTILGLGGEGILRTVGYDRDASRLINRAIDLGITYFESARAYDGSEAYYGRALKERRKDLFLTSKSHARTKAGALDHLEQTLRNMKTDHLDLWQVHDVRTREEIEQLFGPGRGDGSVCPGKAGRPDPVHRDHGPSRSGNNQTVSRPVRFRYRAHARKPGGAGVRQLPRGCASPCRREGNGHYRHEGLLPGTGLTIAVVCRYGTVSPFCPFTTGHDRRRRLRHGRTTGRERRRSQGSFNR